MPLTSIGSILTKLHDLAAYNLTIPLLVLGYCASIEYGCTQEVAKLEMPSSCMRLYATAAVASQVLSILLVHP